MTSSLSAESATRTSSQVAATSGAPSFWACAASGEKRCAMTMFIPEAHGPAARPQRKSRAMSDTGSRS